MHLGFLTDGLAHLSRQAALDVVAGLDIHEVEYATGNWSTAPHLNLEALLNEARERELLLSELAERDIRLGALNCSGNSLHPVTGPQQDAVVHDTIRLAGLLGVSKIVMMSGLPPAQRGDRTPAWITTCWPAENGEYLERQWQEDVIPYWTKLAAFADGQGVDRIALEMHADQVVYNAPTLLRLREAVGPVVGANMDPSHLMWMGADPLASIRMLNGAIHHVHAKDTRLEAERMAVRSRLETLFFDKVAERSWNYVTLGEGHPAGAGFWREFCRTLQASGYDGVLSIEHEDVSYAPEEGLARGASLLREAMTDEQAAV
jgi:sugar phosphate isomerase/epimerase